MKVLKTRWTDLVDRNHVLEEYPRPAMRRESYVNLNGVWEYAITRDNVLPEVFHGEIVVPFSPEAPLSGVGRQLRPDECLWYRRKLPAGIGAKDGKRWILHFGGADQYAVVCVNGRVVKKHLGGYLPFSVDITDVLVEAENELVVRVQDYSDCSCQSRGKQKLKRGGMFYTAQSGIWQTVWMEQVKALHILDLKVTPLYDRQEVEIIVKADADEAIEASTWSEEMEEVCVRGKANCRLRIPVPKMHSWTPVDPFLYGLHVRMGEDEVESYFAMRKLSVKKDGKGLPRVCLNNRPYFQRGVLDQGYWPDGLYTAPCDEAMIFDIKEMKRLGFNMLRKHIKIEPQRWYYHCDRLGMLVWQDIVCGGEPYRHWYVTYAATAMELLHIRPRDHLYRLLGRRSMKSRKLFIKEMAETIEKLSHHPSIVTWVIFNEGWGQFDAQEVTKKAQTLDRTRLYDQASGWFDQGGGDYRSIHNYFFSLKVSPESRVTVLSEFGGGCYKIREHSMFGGQYGYRIYLSKKEMSEGYERLLKKVWNCVDKGLSGFVYTQLSDVEEEVNGIYTYDREVLKIEEEVVIKWNRRFEFGK